MQNFTKLLIALLISIPMIGSSQIDNIEFLKSEAPYESLEDGMSLTADFTEENWEMYYLTFELEEPIRIVSENGVYILSQVELDFDGVMYFDGIDTSTFEDYYVEVVPFDIILDYRYSAGVEEDDSEILYQFEDGVSHFEFRNLSFFYDHAISLSPNARFTFKVSIEHDGGKVTYHYGANRYESAINDIFQIEPLLIGLGIETYSTIEGPEFLFYGFLNGASNDPGLDLVKNDDEWNNIQGMTSIPDEGTVYEFFFSLPTSVNQKAPPLPIQIAPNPGSNYVQIMSEYSFSGGLIIVYVTDMMGRIVMEEMLTDSMRLNTSSLLPGLYHLKIVSKEGSATMPWVKQ